MTGFELLLLILLIIAALSFLAATVGIGGKYNLLALGLFAWVLVPLCQLINQL
jgi:hypothetical protein